MVWGTKVSDQCCLRVIKGLVKSSLRWPCFLYKLSLNRSVLWKPLLQHWTVWPIASKRKSESLRSLGITRRSKLPKHLLKWPSKQRRRIHSAKQQLVHRHFRRVHHITEWKKFLQWKLQQSADPRQQPIRRQLRVHIGIWQLIRLNNRALEQQLGQPPRIPNW